MFCGFNTKMVQGLALFAEGLFEATLDRSSAEKIDIKQAFKTELKDITAFLEGIERLHQETKYKLDRPTTVKTITHWMAENDR